MKIILYWEEGCMNLLQTLRRLWQEDDEIEASLDTE